MKQRGFTLIELLVVIAIIGILASVILASLNTARNKAQDVKIRAELAQLALALNYHYDQFGTYLIPNSGWQDCGCGWVTTDIGPSNRTIAKALGDEGFLPAGGFTETNAPNYMLYLCDNNQHFSLSATLNNPTAADIANTQASCNGTGANGTNTRYGKNYALAQ